MSNLNNTETNIPLVGSINYYIRFNVETDWPVGMNEIETQIYNEEIRVYSGAFDGVAAFYDSMKNTQRYFPIVAELAFIGAVGSRNVNLFNRILKDIEDYPEKCGTDLARMAAEITMIGIKQMLRVSFDYPKWMIDPDFSGVPPIWRPYVGYLVAKRFEREGNLQAALVMADMLLNLVPNAAPSTSIPSTRIKLLKASAFRDSAQFDDSERWSVEAVKAAAGNGLVVPFLCKALGSKSILERTLRKLQPNLLEKIKKLSPDFFRNVVRFHNQLTGESITEALSPREFYLACALKHGMRYKEIAPRMGIAYSRVNGMVTELHEKLHVKKCRDLNVW